MPIYATQTFKDDLDDMIKSEEKKKEQQWREAFGESSTRLYRAFVLTGADEVVGKNTPKRSKKRRK